MLLLEMLISFKIYFVRVLLQDLDISMYGSKMGIIHGTSGEWLLNVTSSPSFAFQVINNFTNLSCESPYARVLIVFVDILNVIFLRACAIEL